MLSDFVIAVVGIVGFVIVVSIVDYYCDWNKWL